MHKKKYICISLLILFFYTSLICIANDKISLKNYNLNNTITVKLPIREASGIAYDKKSNLCYIHEDSNNSNRILVTDTDGKFKHYITLEGLKNNDWEDITSDNNGTFWIIDSKKALYEFKVNTNGKLVKNSIKTLDLPVELQNKNIESLDYLPHNNTFIAIFKGKGNKIYQFKTGDKNATLIGTIPESLKIKPSGLTHNKITGNFFVLAFSGKKIVEFDSTFENILNVLHLPANNLFTFQAEGIDFDNNNNLIIVIEKPWYSLKGHSKFKKLLNTPLNVK